MHQPNLLQVNFFRLIIGLNSLTFSFVLYAQLPLEPHTAEYQINYSNIELGTAKYILPAPDKNGIYKYSFESELEFLLLSDVRSITSNFIIDKTNSNQLLPIRYTLHRKGTGKDYIEQTAFARTQRKIHTKYKEKRNSFEYQTDVFDPLMVQLQLRLDLIAGKKKLKYVMIKSNELDTYQFEILGKESLSIESGTYDAIKIKVIRDTSKRQTYFWLATKLSYLPIKLTHYKKGNKQLDIRLLNYQFSPLQTHLSKTK